MPPPRAALLVLLTLGCKNECLDLCQEYDLYLSECGYGWSTAFEEEGWTSIDDCYDAYWDPSEAKEEWCSAQIEATQERACY